MTSRSTAAALVAAAFLGASTPVTAQRAPAAASPRLPADVLGLICAPQVASEVPPTPLRIVSGQDSFARRIHAPGDLVTINAGSANGIEVGQQYFVRRLQVSSRERVSAATPATVHTAGWITVYAVDEEMSLATIDHACDTVEIGDYLEAFTLPPVPQAAVRRGKPERDRYARVIPGADRRRVFGKGDYVIVNRGSRAGVAAGARFVFYRDKRQPGSFLYEIGEATVVDVKDDTATLQVTLSRDAIYEGDYAAQRK